MPRKIKEKKEKKKRSGLVNALLTLGILICVGVFAFSAYKLISIYLEYKAGVDEYDRLSQYAVSPTPTPTPDAAIPAKPVLSYYPPNVDFKSLQAINPDIVGWLDIEALDISYPIVQGKDNDQYLHRTVEGNSNFAGSIFMDYENKRDFSDPNTVVYGHNMKNQSMFGQLKFIKEQEKYKDSIYFWIVTPTKRYRYQMFSAYVTETGGETYTFFSAPDQQFLDYASKMATRSEIPLPGVTFDANSKVVTLSTCSYNDNVRFVVQGIREGEY